MTQSREFGWRGISGTLSFVVLCAVMSAMAVFIFIAAAIAGERVTVENFTRAETDRTFTRYVELGLSRCKTALAVM